MSGFSSSIPTHLFHGAEIEVIVVGASSLQFVLDGAKTIIFDYYGATEYKNDWLYNLPLCGEDSVQSLVGQKIECIVIKSVDTANIMFSGGKTLEVVHDNVSADMMRFIVEEEEYTV